MGSHKKKGFTSPSPTSARVPEYSVSGSPSPDCTCNYFEAGIYNGKMYLERLDSSYFVYWSLSADWRISQILGYRGPNSWQRTELDMSGEYKPLTGVLGNPIVSLGTH